MKRPPIPWDYEAIIPHRNAIGTHERLVFRWTADRPSCCLARGAIIAALVTRGHTVQVALAKANLLIPRSLEKTNLAAQRRRDELGA